MYWFRVTIEGKTSYLLFMLHWWCNNDKRFMVMLTLYYCLLDTFKKKQTTKRILKVIQSLRLYTLIQKHSSSKKTCFNYFCAVWSTINRFLATHRDIIILCSLWAPERNSASAFRFFFWGLCSSNLSEESNGWISSNWTELSRTLIFKMALSWRKYNFINLLKVG